MSRKSINSWHFSGGKNPVNNSIQRRQLWLQRNVRSFSESFVEKPRKKALILKLYKMYEELSVFHYRENTFRYVKQNENRYGARIQDDVGVYALLFYRALSRNRHQTNIFYLRLFLRDLLNSNTGFAAWKISLRARLRPQFLFITPGFFLELITYTYTRNELEKCL